MLTCSLSLTHCHLQVKLHGGGLSKSLKACGQKVFQGLLAGSYHKNKNWVQNKKEGQPFCSKGLAPPVTQLFCTCIYYISTCTSFQPVCPHRCIRCVLDYALVWQQASPRSNQGHGVQNIFFFLLKKPKKPHIYTKPLVVSWALYIHISSVASITQFPQLPASTIQGGMQLPE